MADPDLLCGAHSTSVPHVSTPLLLATPHTDRVITAIYACEEAVGAEGSPAFNALLVLKSKLLRSTSMLSVKVL